jgi:mitochondrial fission protein ELM1
MSLYLFLSVSLFRTALPAFLPLRPCVVRRVGKDTVPLVLWVLRAQAGQVGLVAVQAPRVKALLLDLVPISVF